MELLETLNEARIDRIARGRGLKRAAVREVVEWIRQGAPLGVVAEFGADVTEGVAPLDVAFSNRSTGAAEFAWDFGDGTLSTESDPSHTYAAGGSFLATLTVTGASSETDTVMHHIRR